MEETTTKCDKTPYQSCFCFLCGFCILRSCFEIVKLTSFEIMVNDKRNVSGQNFLTTYVFWPLTDLHVSAQNDLVATFFKNFAGLWFALFLAVKGLINSEVQIFFQYLGLYWVVESMKICWKLLRRESKLVMWLFGSYWVFLQYFYKGIEPAKFLNSDSLRIKIVWICHRGFLTT